MSNLALEDLAALQDVLERCSDYYELVEGRPPPPHEARTIYDALPDDVESRDAKLLLAVLGEEDAMIGVADIIRGWPTPRCWIIGLLLLVPEARSGGLGSLALSLIESRAAAEGAESMRVAVYRANDRGLSFWQSHGYATIDESKKDPIPLAKAIAGPPGPPRADGLTA